MIDSDKAIEARRLRRELKAAREAAKPKTPAAPAVDRKAAWKRGLSRSGDAGGSDARSMWKRAIAKVNSNTGG